MYKLIIIDDEKWSREVVKKLIRYDAMKCTLVGEAENGFNGYELIRALEPDIVITDMKMPGLNGVELLKKVSVEYPRIKTIVMSGFEDYTYLRQAIRSKSVEYLLKPIKEDDINQAILHCIDEIKRSKRVNLSASRVFQDETIQREYNRYLKQLNLVILKQKSDEIEHTLNGVKFYEDVIKTPEMVNKVKESLLNQVAQYLLTQSFDFSYDIEEVRNETLDGMLKDVKKIYHDVMMQIESVQTLKYSGDIQSILDFIDQHYMYQISLNDVAEMFNISKEHMSRTFKKHTGEGVTQYILRKKMEGAVDLIRSTDYSMKEIGELMGFENIPYFYKMFKKKFDCSPGEYKESLNSLEKQEMSKK